MILFKQNSDFVSPLRLTLLWILISLGGKAEILTSGTITSPDHSLTYLLLSHCLYRSGHAGLLPAPRVTGHDLASGPLHRPVARLPLSPLLLHLFQVFTWNLPAPRGLHLPSYLILQPAPPPNLTFLLFLSPSARFIC